MTNQNINMYDYEVAGIALNGGEHVIVRNIHLTNISRNIPAVLIALWYTLTDNLFY